MKKFKIGQTLLGKINGKSCLKKVKYEPWFLSCGVWVIGLEEISGGYPIIVGLKKEEI